MHWANFSWLLTELERDDDLDFWEAAVDHVFADVDARCSLARKGVLAEVGRSSQWLRPHQTRWTADGGFAWPAGYGEASLTGTRVRGNPNATWSASRLGLPAFDWFDRWRRQPNGVWEPADPRERVRPRQFLFRVALPARTRRHRQGVVHTVWPFGHPAQPRTRVFKLYGFRHQDGGWRCTATHELSG